MNHTLDRLTFGAATLGNLLRPMSDKEAQELLAAVWDTGIRAFDTAPHYGLGLSETRLGAFLRERPRSQWTLSTKVGRLLRPNPGHDGELDQAEGFAVPATTHRVWDASPAGVLESVEASLTRLGTDRVDVLYLHDPERYGDCERLTNQGLASLADARGQGLATRVGVGSVDTDTLALAAAHEATDEIMVAGRHTLVDDDAALRVLPTCRARGVHVVPASVYASGLLARSEPAGTYEYSPAPETVLARARRIADVCAAHGTDLPTAALHFVALDQSVTSVCIGARTPDQVRQSVERWLTPVDAALWPALVETGLLPIEGVPA